MRIATADKQLNPVSSVYRRPRAGAKGIGRFAARRLAANSNSCPLHDRTQTGRLNKTTVQFDWDAFQPGEDVQSVPVSYEHQDDRRGAHRRV